MSETLRRAFVAGATGYVGREVVRLLREAGIETTAHIRPGSSSRERWTARFAELGAHVDASPWQREALEEALARAAPDCVFALLGTTRARAKSESIDGDAYEKIDYGLTAMLFEAAVKLASPPRFVYLSAVGVSASSRTAYMKARAKAEALIAAGPLPYVFARPAVITGADRDEQRAGERIAGKALDGALAVVGAFGGKKLRQRYRSTTNTTLAAALVRLALESSEPSVIAEGEDLR